MVSETLSWGRRWRSADRFLDCGRGLCRWASPDFELVPWAGVAGAFDEEVVGGGRRRKVGGGDRAVWEILKILGDLGEEMGGKGKAHA
jgi:hypothetical protein